MGDSLSFSWGQQQKNKLADARSLISIQEGREKKEEEEGNTSLFLSFLTMKKLAMRRHTCTKCDFLNVLASYLLADG
jgi:hypothetical protein